MSKELVRVAAVSVIAAAFTPGMYGWARPTADPQETGAQVAKQPFQLALLGAPNGEEGQEANQKVLLELVAADAQVVKGKPYSADTSTETIKTLEDGNRIVHRTVSRFYRDNEGRTRREETFGNVDPARPSPHEVKIFIDDPVTGTAYVLDPGSKSADKVQRSARFLEDRNAEDDGTRTMFKSVLDKEETGPVTSDHPGRVLIDVQGEHGTGSNPLVVAFQNEKRDVVKEDLGTKSIDGVDCNGTRQTITIPAGDIGNEKPIQIVTETWFAPSIGAVVQSTTNDPRFGQTSYQLSNLQTTEPAPHLFAPPADFRLNTPRK